MTARRTLVLSLVAVALVAAAGRAQIPAPMVPAPVPSSPGIPPSLPIFDDEPGVLVNLLLRSVGLSTEQSHRVQQIISTRKDTLAAAGREVRAAQDALADRMTTPGAVIAKDLQPQVDRLAKAHRSQIEEIVATALRVRDVLTPEQLARAARWKDRFRRVRNEFQELADDGGGS